MNLIRKWPDFLLAYHFYLAIPKHRRFPSNPLVYLSNFIFDDKGAKIVSSIWQTIVDERIKKYESRSLMSRLRENLET